AAPHPRARHQARRRGEGGRRRQPRHDHLAHASPADDRARGQVQHGVLPGHPPPRSKGGPGRVPGRRRSAPRRPGDGEARELPRPPGGGACGLDKMTSILKIQMKDGRVFAGRAEFAKGSPKNPMSYDEVADKLRGCAEFAKWPAAKAEAVIVAVKGLETVADVSVIARALTV